MDWKEGDIVMIRPREGNSTSKRFPEGTMYRIISFYTSIAHLKCAWVKRVNGGRTPYNVTIDRFLPAFDASSPSWEV